ncbi:MAG: carboxyl transferase domain-containing protein [Myxococcota bacterium]
MKRDDSSENRLANEPDSAADPGWKPRLEELAKRQQTARGMGGRAKLEKQRAHGRLDARARVERLLDAESFVEIGALAGGLTEPDAKATPADALVAGFGRIDGRPVLVGSEDFTVMGGSIGPAAAVKRYRLTQLAAQERVPLVMLLEGGGHRMTNTLRSHGRSPNDLQGLAELSGRVPTVCVVMGPSAGHGALTAPLMDFVIMVEGASLFSAGPPLVAAALGEKVEKEELGGAQVHVAQSGVAHNRAPDDPAGLDRAREYLSYFPSNAWQSAPRRDGPDTGERQIDEILALVPVDSRRPYKMRRLLELLVDEHRILEIQPEYGASLITAIARLGGQSVAILANDPSVRAGAVDSAAAEKGSRFLEIVGGFHLPVVFLADNPGVLAGTAAERAGALRQAARLFAAQHRLRSPKISVTLRKAYGFGSSIMAMNPFDDQTLSLAFPGVALGAMPARGGSEVAKAGAELRAQLEDAESEASYRIASTLGFDDVIDPRELRNALLRGLELASAREQGDRAPIAHTGALP